MALHTEVAILRFHMRFCLRRVCKPLIPRSVWGSGRGQVCLQAEQGFTHVWVLFSVWVRSRLGVLSAEDKSGPHSHRNPSPGPDTRSDPGQVAHFL